MFNIFGEYKNLNYGMSIKADGPIELGSVSAGLAVNREKFFKSQGLRKYKLLIQNQTHSNQVAKVSLADVNQKPKDCDALVTHDLGLILAVTTADCFPIYFYNPRKSIIGIAHSGWRGTVSNIAEKTVKAIGQNPKEVIVGIGTGIQVCHFEIKNGILHKFSAYKDAVERRENKIYVNLPKIIKNQLIQAGVLEANIESSNGCTYCQKDKYFSYRRDKPSEVQAMLAYIGMR